MNYKKALIYALFLLAGCSSNRENKFFSHSKIQNKSILLAHTVCENDQANFYAEGNQGILDFVIMSAFIDSMKENLKNLHATPIVQSNYYIPFEEALKKRSAQTTYLPQPIKSSKLNRHENNEEHIAAYDLRYLKQNKQSDYAFVLHLKKFGVERNYYGFLPTGSPFAVADIEISLVNLTNNALEGHYQQKIELSISNWDNPPYYPEVNKKVKAALEQSINHAYNYFFRY